MAVTVESLRIRLNATTADDDLIAESLALAVDLVGDYVTASNPGDSVTIPTSVRERAVTECAVTAFNQAKAVNGVMTQAYEFGNDAPIRIARDPMKNAEAILNRYLAPLGFA